VIISLVSFTVMLVYWFEMSNEARVKWGIIGVFSSFLSLWYFPGCVCWGVVPSVLFCERIAGLTCMLGLLASSLLAGLDIQV
jgi:hypothetical protein